MSKNNVTSKFTTVYCLFRIRHENVIGARSLKALVGVSAVKKLCDKGLKLSHSGQQN